ncbi:MAG: pilus assembly protein PilM [Candidatus Scalindua sp.]|jgi:type IV pilus assembly protein PilM|nr:pilus assembly protein PilM [Candidatus Scalindua sp.]MBT5306514.1 pilus assembly protein PilM [Candidatus Scalindua sp.]MBT6046938.1 pilus assembly protein PilM [Candidatus Scalindua sp.]MBT6227575.1 pilus assembly protein PilM [Candidatus Scalindua sp.]MBT6561394.1 pilus assembly protein PilM [Candidatus Scalindua sp.]
MNFRAIYKKGSKAVGLSGDKSAWGLEIGDSGIKAVKASSRDGELFVEAIDRIDYSSLEHEITPKKPELIESAVTIFKERNLINKSDKVIVSLSGKMILSRFFTLPPIKKSRIGDVLKFELRKQVPFEPDEIVWDYQQFDDDGTSNEGVKIGLFATKKENIYSLLPALSPIKVSLDAIQITPIAIYNLVHLSSDSNEDAIVINVEQGNTDFIVVGRSKYWNRSIPISEVNMSLIREIQRSMGYYVSVSKGAKPEILYLMGDVFEDDNKIKFVDENLEGKVQFLDLLDKIRMVKDFDHPSLVKKNIYGFETALGLALQGLNLGEIRINLLPDNYVKERQIAGRKTFASIIAIAIFLSFFTQSIKDYLLWKPLSNSVETVTVTLNEANRLERVFKGIEKKVKAEEDNLHLWESIGKRGNFWIETLGKIINTIPENVYLLSIESLWGIPEAGNKERASSKDFFGGKGATTSKNIDTSKEVLIIKIMGESYAPEVSYIEEKVKKAIANLTLADQKKPVFSDVRLVQGSVYHVVIPDKKNAADDIKSTPICFELQCIVDSLN